MDAVGFAVAEADRMHRAFGRRKAQAYRRRTRNHKEPSGLPARSGLSPEAPENLIWARVADGLIETAPS